MIVIVGAVISLPPFSPGMAWNWLQFVLGLQRLGHTVYFVEEIEPEWCVDRRGRESAYATSLNRALFQTTMSRFGLMNRACQLYDGGRDTTGLTLSTLMAVARKADLLVNMSGHVKAETLLSKVRRRVYVDQDPVYTQLWATEYGQDAGLAHHDLFFSVGLNIGTRHTTVPDAGRSWHPLLPARVLELAPFRRDGASEHFTTLASLSGYGDVRYRGRWYRSKYTEFARFAELPRRTGRPFEVVLKRYRWDDPVVRALEGNGWLVSGGDRIRDVAGYRRFIARSRAEIGIAKHAYVRGRSGWFSDRSADYLAAGKPVVAQSTGFERWLPTGRGLLSFGNLDQAVAAIEAVDRDYEEHCRAAREFAVEFLDYRKVLPPMLEIATG
jgi:hypothetical protein